MAPKFNSLCKRVGRKKNISPMLSVPKGTFYYAKDYQYAKNNCYMFPEMGKMCGQS
jgi:hypothetical protein